MAVFEPAGLHFEESGIGAKLLAERLDQASIMPKTVRCGQCGFQGEVRSNRKSCPHCGAHSNCAPREVPANRPGETTSHRS